MIARSRPEDGGPDPRIFLDFIVRHMGRIARAASRLEVLASDLELRAVEFLKTLGPAPGSTSVKQPARGALRGLSSREKERFQRAAEQGFSRMEYQRRKASGSAEVSIDGSPTFTLTPKLADLLEIISIGVPDPRDGFPSWRSFEDVWLLLEKRRLAGKRSKPRSIFELIRKLRVSFLDHGANPYFIQTRPGRGVRLALRAGARPVIDGEPS